MRYIKGETRDHDGMANLKIGSTLIMQFCFLLSNPLQAVPFLLRIHQHKILQRMNHGIGALATIPQSRE
jgi:hypothetical protein